MTKEQIEQKIEELKYSIFIEQMADFMDFEFVRKTQKEIKELEELL